jgi:hypothetical protein
MRAHTLHVIICVVVCALMVVACTSPEKGQIDDAGSDLPMASEVADDVALEDSSDAGKSIDEGSDAGPAPDSHIAPNFEPEFDTFIMRPSTGPISEGQAWIDMVNSVVYDVSATTGRYIILTSLCPDGGSAEPGCLFAGWDWALADPSGGVNPNLDLFEDKLSALESELKSRIDSQLPASPRNPEPGDLVVIDLGLKGYDLAFGDEAFRYVFGLDALNPMVTANPGGDGQAFGRWQAIGASLKRIADHCRLNHPTYRWAIRNVPIQAASQYWQEGVLGALSAEETAVKYSTLATTAEVATLIEALDAVVVEMAPRTLNAKEPEKGLVKVMNALMHPDFANKAVAIISNTFDISGSQGWEVGTATTYESMGWNKANSTDLTPSEKWRTNSRPELDVSYNNTQVNNPFIPPTVFDDLVYRFRQADLPIAYEGAWKTATQWSMAADTWTPGDGGQSGKNIDLTLPWVRFINLKDAQNLERFVQQVERYYHRAVAPRSAAQFRLMWKSGAKLEYPEPIGNANDYWLARSKELVVDKAHYADKMLPAFEAINMTDHRDYNYPLYKYYWFCAKNSKTAEGLGVFNGKEVKFGLENGDQVQVDFHISHIAATGQGGARNYFFEKVLLIENGATQGEAKSLLVFDNALKDSWAAIQAGKPATVTFPNGDPIELAVIPAPNGEYDGFDPFRVRKQFPPKGNPNGTNPLKPNSEQDALDWITETADILIATTKMKLQHVYKKNEILKDGDVIMLDPEIPFFDAGSFSSSFRLTAFDWEVDKELFAYGLIGAGGDWDRDAFESTPHPTPVYFSETIAKHRTRELARVALTLKKWIGETFLTAAGKPFNCRLGWYNYLTKAMVPFFGYMFQEDPYLYAQLINETMARIGGYLTDEELAAVDYPLPNLEFESPMANGNAYDMESVWSSPHWSGGSKKWVSQAPKKLNGPYQWENHRSEPAPDMALQMFEASLTAMRAQLGVAYVHLQPGWGGHFGNKFNYAKGVVPSHSWVCGKQDTNGSLSNAKYNFEYLPANPLTRTRDEGKAWGESVEGPRAFDNWERQILTHRFALRHISWVWFDSRFLGHHKNNFDVTMKNGFSTQSKSHGTEYMAVFGPLGAQIDEDGKVIDTAKYLEQWVYYHAESQVSGAEARAINLSYGTNDKDAPLPVPCP